MAGMMRFEVRRQMALSPDGWAEPAAVFEWYFSPGMEQTKRA
jgi:hypothetical protein